MASRAKSDEFYVLEHCDAVLGQRGRRQHRFDWLRADPLPNRRRGTALPVDSYWPDLELVVEFREQDPEAEGAEGSDALALANAHRGQQRRQHDQRRETEIPEHGIRLVVITTADFESRGALIDRDEARDRGVVARALGVVAP